MDDDDDDEAWQWTLRDPFEISPYGSRYDADVFSICIRPSTCLEDLEGDLLMRSFIDGPPILNLRLTFRNEIIDFPSHTLPSPGAAFERRKQQLLDFLEIFLHEEREIKYIEISGFIPLEAIYIMLARAKELETLCLCDAQCLASKPAEVQNLVTAFHNSNSSSRSAVETLHVTVSLAYVPQTDNESWQLITWSAFVWSWILPACPSLKRFRLYANDCLNYDVPGDPGFVTNEMWSSFLAKPQLQELDIHIYSTSSCISLMETLPQLPSTLRKLKIQTWLCPGLCEALAQYLCRPRQHDKHQYESLVELDIVLSGFVTNYDEDARAIVCSMLTTLTKGLGTNKTLQTFRMTEDPDEPVEFAVQSDFVDLFAKALYHNTTLTSCDLNYSDPRCSAARNIAMYLTLNQHGRGQLLANGSNSTNKRMWIHTMRKFQDDLNVWFCMLQMNPTLLGSAYTRGRNETSLGSSTRDDDENNNNLDDDNNVDYEEIEWYEENI